jgi:hypothetical protein
MNAPQRDSAIGLRKVLQVGPYAGCFVEIVAVENGPLLGGPAEGRPDEQVTVWGSPPHSEPVYKVKLLANGTELEETFSARDLGDILPGQRDRGACTGN